MREPHASEIETRSLDRNGLEILTRAECLRLLSTTRVGHVAITAQALPVILPITFKLLDHNVVFATGEGTKLAAATERQVIAFEADEVDADGKHAWSVCITGVAEVITDPAEIARVEALDISPLVDLAQPRFVQISTEMMSGRRVP